MVCISLVLLFLLSFFSLASPSYYDDPLLKSTLEEYFHTGQPTELLHQTLKSYRMIFEKGPREDNPQLCFLCNLVVGLVISERLLGLSRDTVVEEISVVCIDLDLETERVCRGVVELNVDPLLYMIDNLPNITSDRVCGSVLQSSGCALEGDFEWTINIPPGNSPERSQPNGTQVPSFRILQLSDFHYDPEYTPGGNAACGEPVCCQIDQGEPATPQDACGYWTDYRDGDAPWHLVEESVRKAKEVQSFDYVYYTGDVISHRVWDTSVEKNTEDLNRIYSYLKEQFDVPVFPVFGNHEPHPLNLWPVDEAEGLNAQWLFQLAADHWSALIGQNVSDTVLKGGYYSVSPKPGFRIIGINSNLGYTDNFWLIYNDVDPFGQLQWLSDTLKEAEDNNESVHLLSHVPSGGDFLNVWSREFLRILERFANTITGQFNGHTHHDGFHVYYNSSDRLQAIGVAFNGASITPFSNNNPSFKYYTVDNGTFNLLDYEEWYFNLTLANALGEGASVPWEKLYSFVDTYGSANLLPSEVDQVLYRMAENHSLLDDYFKFKSRNSDADMSGGCNDDCKKDLLCDIVTTYSGNTEQCDRFSGMYDQ